MKLYKYHRCNKRLLEQLINYYTWYSDPLKLNDPFEGTMVLHKKIQKYINKRRLLCLSEEKDNLLLWSHYADSHKGCCLEYTDYTDEEIQVLKQRRQLPEFANDKISIIRNAKKVAYLTADKLKEYSESLPKDNDAITARAKSLGDYEKIVDEFSRSTLYKHNVWEYEKEYRIIAGHDERQKIFPPGKITAIYFGFSMPGIDKRTIAKIVRSDDFVENNLGHSCQLYSMKKPVNSYFMIPEVFNASEDLKDETGLSF